jgi:hypothetical protein
VNDDNLPMCDECGNDVPVEGLRYCLDCDAAVADSSPVLPTFYHGTRAGFRSRGALLLPGSGDRVIPDLSRLDRYDRGVAPDVWCAGCGHELEYHTHWRRSGSTHCAATVDTFVQANVLRTAWCDCEEFTGPVWTVGQRVGVAVTVLLYLAILSVVAWGLGVGR